VLLLVAVASAIPGGAFGGLTSAFVSAPLRAVGLGRGSYVAVSLRPSKPVVGALRMAREDGGADKIKQPGQGKPVGPGQGGGVGPNEGAGEQERGGAGVAVLTKPPDLDKVPPFPPAPCKGRFRFSPASRCSSNAHAATASWQR
jgi:hypothetical protein